MINNIKKVSPKIRKRIIEIVDPGKRNKEVLIYKYCDELTREEISSKMFIEPESLDKLMTKARKQFNEYLISEYELYSNDDKKIIDLIRG